MSALFQPIADLETGEAVGFEALARGPIDTELERAEELFKAARARGCLPCWMGPAAPRRSRPPWPPISHPPSRSSSTPSPRTLGEPCPTRYAGTFALARERLRVVIELTERALTARPAELLHAVARMRDWGWSIALDDVGSDPRSLALLPLLGPDVIKLDMRLIQRARPPRSPPSSTRSTPRPSAPAP